jgi:small subunit ribosomal protein S6
MRRYETTYILRPNLGEEQFSEIIERTNTVITDDGGAVIELQRLGNRKLAYEIKKENLGHYIYFDFAAPGSTILEMERIFRIDDRVLRFLTVKLADSIDEETVVSETERVAALAAEKLSSETESSAEDSASEKSDASADQKASDSDKTDEAKKNAPEADEAKADAPDADAPEAGEAKASEAKAGAPDADAPDADAPEADEADADVAKEDAPEADAPDADKK